MICIIAGSRNATKEETYKAIQESGFMDEISTVVSGCAKGADTWGEAWAKERWIKISRYPADWTKYGKAAGPIRNLLMATVADALIAVRINNSRGATDMIEKATAKGLRVHVLDISR
jgi:predicted Rossmann fold nucleotide-binding protein DprA/Smf involved in DNA uptake